MDIKPQKQVGAVLMDGSALFFAARDLYPGTPLNYEELTTSIRAIAWSKEFGCEDSSKGPCGIWPPAIQAGPFDYPPQTSWIMWSAISAKNEGQARFLKHVEGLGWCIRSFAPADSFMVDPVTTLSLAAGTRVGERMTRFDASIAYMIGRLAEQCQIVLLSDSFALAEPLVRASRARYRAEHELARKENRDPKQMPPNILAFFGRALDPRWFAVLRHWHEEGYGGNGGCVNFFDLDSRKHLLFGVSPVREQPWLDSDIPDRRSEDAVNLARAIELEQENQRLRKQQKKGETT